MIKIGEKIPKWMEEIAESGGFEEHAIEKRKAEAEAYRELAKIKKETWEAMGQTFIEIKDFSRSGGFIMLLGGSVDRLKDQISSHADAALAPLVTKLGEVGNVIVDELSPALEGATTAASKFLTILTEFEVTIPGTGEKVNIFEGLIKLLGDSINKALAPANALLEYMDLLAEKERRRTEAIKEEADELEKMSKISRKIWEIEFGDMW